MSIQLPVIIWTVICFCLFALVMSKLLFEPVLKNMDARKARIEKAHSDAEAARAALIAEREAACVLAEEEAERQAEEDAKALAQYREKAAKELSAHAQELAAMKGEYAEKAETLSREAYSSITLSFDKMVDAFTEKLVTGGRK